MESAVRTASHLFFGGKRRIAEKGLVRVGMPSRGVRAWTVP